MPRMLRKAPLAANPNRDMLMIMKARWFHWLMEKNLARRISNMIADIDTRKTAAIWILEVLEEFILFTADERRLLQTAAG